MPLGPSPSAPYCWYAIRSLNAKISSSKDEYLKRKNLCTADWVYVLDVRCYIYSSVQVAQEFLLDDDAKYFRRNK